MENSTGWIKLHRSILDDWFWNEKPFSKGQAFTDLLLLANHTDVNTVRNGKIVTYKRGTVNRSILSLADRWGWERKKVRKFLRDIELDGIATTSSTTHGTTITIVKYDFFQGLGSTHRTNEGTSIPQQTVQQFPINKNDKNIKNEKNNKIFVPPTTEEVKKYCLERRNNIDPEMFVDYYEARGWVLSKGSKMKDWKACVRTWEKNKYKLEKERNAKANANVNDTHSQYRNGVDDGRKGNKFM